MQRGKEMADGHHTPGRTVAVACVTTHDYTRFLPPTSQACPHELPLAAWLLSSSISHWTAAGADAFERSSPASESSLQRCRDGICAMTRNTLDVSRAQSTFRLLYNTHTRVVTSCLKLPALSESPVSEDASSHAVRAANRCLQAWHTADRIC